MGADEARTGGALIALGAFLYAAAYLWAGTGSVGDANIGAGVLGLIGVALSASGVLVLAVGALISVWRAIRRLLRRS